KSADTDKSLKEKKEATDKLLKSPTITGRLVEWGGEQKTITMMVPIQVPNPSGIQHQLDLQKSLAEASMDRNLANRLNRMADIQRQMEKNKPNMVKEEQVKMLFEPIDDLIVRLGQLPPIVDDKGKPRKYTDKEKRELKGPDPKLPGYTGSMADLKNDQVVTVYLQKKKDPKSS